MSILAQKVIIDEGYLKVTVLLDDEDGMLYEIETKEYNGVDGGVTHTTKRFGGFGRLITSSSITMGMEAYFAAQERGEIQ